MKNFKIQFCFLIALMLSAVASISAQYDDLYYDPQKDGNNNSGYIDNQSSNTYSDQSNSNAKQNSKPDNGSQYDNNYYNNNNDVYDDYDYYYSSRIRRFNRPYTGFGYFDDCYVGSNFYDPYWSGTTIYVGYNNYYDYNRYRRYSNYNYWNNWGPTYNWGGWGYSPLSWGFGYNSWNSYSPWGWNVYNPCPPYGNIIVNNVYYGNNWGYNNGYYSGNYNNGGYYNEYTSNVHYGPRRATSTVTELKGNPRGKYSADFENPRGQTNQTHTNANPGRENNNNGTIISRPDRAQVNDVPVRPDRPTKTDAMPARPQIGRDKDVAPNKQDVQSRPDRPVINREQLDNKPYTPTQTDRPTMKDNQTPVRDQQIKRDRGSLQNSVDNGSESGYRFNSQPSKNDNSDNNNTYERPARQDRNTVTEERPVRQERNIFKQERPARQEQAPRQEVQQRNYSPSPSTRNESPAPRSNNSSGSNKSSGGSSNPRGRK